MIEIKNMTKWYWLQGRKHYVYKDFNLSLKAHQNLGLIGRNGAGKSTLVRMLSGIERPSEGSIDIEGSVSWPVAAGVGFQVSLPGRDNVRFVCRVHGIIGKQMAYVCEWVKAISGIGDFFEEPIRTYSSGMRSRFTFCLSMAIDFDLLLMDEVTSVGDKNFRELSRKMLENRMKRSSLVYVSHNLNEIKRLCNCALLFTKQGPIFYEDVNLALCDYDKGI